MEVEAAQTNAVSVSGFIIKLIKIIENFLFLKISSQQRRILVNPFHLKLKVIM